MAFASVRQHAALPDAGGRSPDRQWLTFGASSSPADLYSVGLAAWERRDYPEALRVWSHGTALQPGDAVLHFWRASALARLGQRHAAADGFRLALMLDPPQSVAAAARQELARDRKSVV